jgi:polysaccharide pyruvyl transferase WcaK-like protein
VGFWRDRFWLTDEALGTYGRSAGLFGSEMHSPIMAVANGIPAIVCRFEEQTSKGFMWRDIGRGEWLFDLDREDEARQVVPAVLAMVRNPESARAKVRQAMAFVRERQRQTMTVLARNPRSGPGTGP